MRLYFRHTLLIAKIVATLLLSYWLYLYIVENSAEFEFVLSSISWRTSLCILGCYGLSLYVQSRILFNGNSDFFSDKLNFLSKAIKINCSSTLMGFLLPSGAFLSKIVFLNRVFHIKNIKSAAILAKITNIQISTTVLLGTCIFVLYALSGKITFPQNNPIEGLEFIVAGAFILFVCIYTYLKRNDSEKKTSFYQLVESVIPVDLKQATRVAVWHTVQQMLFAIILFMYLRSVGLQIGFIDSLAIVLISALALIVSLTPGNIGFKEGVYHLVSMLLGIEVTVVVAILLVDRVVQLVFFLLALTLAKRLSSKV